MTSTFPEVRIKRTIEVRGADCVSQDLAIAFCSLFTGLLYDDAALSKGLELADEVTGYGTREERFNVACREGVQGQFGSVKILDLAQKMVAIGAEGLGRFQPHNQQLINPIIDQLHKGCSPSHDLLKEWHKNPSPEHIIETLRY